MTRPPLRRFKSLLFTFAHMGLGLATHVPKLRETLMRGTGGTDAARYCYSVWMRHVVKAHSAGVWNRPRSVAELGPGDSLGIGLAALLTGAECYRAFDVVEHASDGRNLKVFDELVELVRARTDIPGEDEFPVVKPFLEDYRFPAEIFSDAEIDAWLEPERIRRIRSAIEKMGEDEDPDSPIRYVVPWMGDGASDTSSMMDGRGIDMIYSQAVLEHVAGLDEAYGAMRGWLKPDGFISHQIDFKCHGTALDWDGHWAVPAPVWKIMHGTRPYLINRQPRSEHLRLLEKNRFKVAHQSPVHATSTLTRGRLAREFQDLPDSDLNTSGLYVLAVPGG